MAPGIAPSDVMVSRPAGTDGLLLAINGTVDQLLSQSFFYSPNYEIERVTFSDGTVWNGATLRNMASAITGTAGADTLTGTSGDDRLYGLGGNDTLNGNAGNDLLDGGAGTDTMNGGTGNDTYIVDNTGDIVTESSSTGGTDTIQSSVTRTLGTNQENLTLTGTGAINATGNTLANIIIGNSANNTLSGGTGADRMEGGLGNDTYVVDNTGDVVVENLGEGTDLIQTSITLSLANIANVENLTLTGTSAINGTGNTLDNVLTGNSANNTLTGDGGNDTLNGGTGTDTMLGGTGNDIYVVNVSTDVVTENANEGTDTIQSSVTLSLVTRNNVENLTLTGTSAINATGNTLDNVLVGNSAVNTLDGGAGNDTLDGGAGNDILRGGTGNDTYVFGTGDTLTENANEGTDTVMSAVTHTLLTNFENLTLTGTSAINATGNTLNNQLTGNSANNTLTGNAGNDTLNGMGGTDTSNGGTGNDTYVFNRGDGQDTVTDNDTTTGNQDTVQLGVNPLDLVFTRATNNLQLSLHGGTDRLTVSNWYTNASYQTEVIRAADGRTLLNTQIDQLIQAMAQFSANNGGITWDQAIDQRPAEVEGILASFWEAPSGVMTSSFVTAASSSVEMDRTYVAAAPAADIVEFGDSTAEAGDPRRLKLMETITDVARGDAKTGEKKARDVHWTIRQPSLESTNSDLRVAPRSDDVAPADPKDESANTASKPIHQLTRVVAASQNLDHVRWTIGMPRTIVDGSPSYLRAAVSSDIADPALAQLIQAMAQFSVANRNGEGGTLNGNGEEWMVTLAAAP